MQPDPPLLTIAIPTYNRVAYLGDLLSSLFDQLLTEPFVELIISDNASSDETPVLINEYRRRGLPLRYIRNETNLGADGNILQCFEQARGKYVWIIGDDDILLEGCIKQLMFHLAIDEYDLLYLAPYGFDNSPIIDFKPDPLGREVITINNADLFVKKIGTMFSLISCNIVNKERLLQIGHQPFVKYIGTNLIQLSWTYPLLTRFSKGLYVFHRFLAIRNGTSGEYSVARVFGVNLKGITDELLSENPRLAKLIYRSAITGFFPFAILKVRQQKHGNFAIEDFHASLRVVYGYDYQYWLYVYPVAQLPLRCASAWWNLVRGANFARSGARYIFRLAKGIS